MPNAVLKFKINGKFREIWKDDVCIGWCEIADNPRSVLMWELPGQDEDRTLVRRQALADAWEFAQRL